MNPPSAAVIGAGLAGIACAAYGWRHARVEAPLGEPFLLDDSTGIGFCGDWCLDARIEAAFLSGDAIGAALAATR
jgi:predicted NAD/FAD-dependent oxidoreductase